MESYFAEPDLITLGILIVDARHAPTQNDVTMASWFQQTGCPFVVVANKLDKLKKREIEPNLACIREVLSLSEDTILLPFSAEKGTGRDQLVGIIEAAAAGKLSDI
jgi:GTP-binding protein